MRKFIHSGQKYHKIYFDFRSSLPQNHMNEKLPCTPQMGSQDVTIMDQIQFYDKSMLDWPTQHQSTVDHSQLNMMMAAAGHQEQLIPNNSFVAGGVSLADISGNATITTAATPANVGVATDNAAPDKNLTLMNLMKLMELEETSTAAVSCMMPPAAPISPAMIPAKLDPSAALVQNGRPITGNKLGSSTAIPPPPPITSFPPPPLPPPPPMNLAQPPPYPVASAEPKPFCSPSPVLTANFKVPPPTHPPAVPPPTFSVPPPGMAAACGGVTTGSEGFNNAASFGQKSSARSHLAIELHLRLEQAYEQFR